MTEAKPQPDLSVVVAIVSDTTDPNVDLSLLRDCLNALTRQQVDVPVLEIIVPYLNHVKGIDEVAREFPVAIFLPVDAPDMSNFKGGNREHHDIIRAHGLKAGTGRILALLEDHEIAEPGWARAVVTAHEGDEAGIGGSIGNAVDSALNWAVYFCDFCRYQNPVPEGPTDFASDANTSYKREDLFSVQPVWDESFREVVVNGAFREAGKSVVLTPSIVALQNRRNLTLGQALKERFVWGRSFAATRNRSLSGAKRAVYALASPILPFLLFLRFFRITKARGQNMSALMRSSPLIILLLLTWSVGEATGYVSGLTE